MNEIRHGQEGPMTSWLKPDKSAKMQSPETLNFFVKSYGKAFAM